MNDNSYFTALLDTCLFEISPAQEVVLESLDGSMPSLRGPRNSLARLVTRRLPKNIPDNERWKLAQSEAMHGVAESAREGKVHLFTYDEIELETLSGTLFPSGVVAHCLAGVKIDYVRAAIERSRFQQMPLDTFAEKSTRVDFCRWLLSLDYRELAKRPKFMSMFSDFERRNLESLGRFREICANLDETHYSDALHLWTAEVNSLDFFLTSDKKFINVMTKTSQVALTTRPICPCDFLRVLKDKRERESIKV